MIPGADAAVVATAFSVANAMGASPKVMLSLFEAGIVESGFRNLNYGADDSVGYLQQRPSQGWPDPMNVTTATRSYVSRAMANEKKYPSYSPGRLAQSVQRSAFPDKYDKVEPQARAMLGEVGKNKPGFKLPLPIPGMPGIGIPLPPVLGPGGQPDLGLVDGISAVADALKTMASGVVNVGGLATQLTKLALPTNVVRAAAGGLGIIFLFTGVLIIGRQVR